MVVFGFAGLSLGGDHLALDPKLPASWKCLSFSVQWRNRRLKIKLIPAMQRLEATLETGKPMKLAVSGKVFDLTPLETLRIATISTTSRSPGESNG